MRTPFKLRLASSALIVALAVLFFAMPSHAETEKRIAFVVGNAAYPAAPLDTSANDAGLIAQTLQAAGFDVTGARDLDGEALRAAFRDFLEKAQASGPDTVAFVYLSGYGLQLGGENYFVPVDAKIAAAPDIATEGLRVSDYMKRLAGLPLKASFVVLDAAREQPFGKTGPPLAGGLALADAEPNMLLAFNAAPGTVAPKESGPYGAYAQALAEMIREGGLPPAEVFDGVRLRVNEETKGAQVPWDATRISAPFIFLERAADAPPPAFAANKIMAMRSQPLRELGAQDAYAAALERDTLQGYEDFIAAYPSDPLAKRVRALLAARREAVTWRRSCSVDTPDAYWSYLDRYPRGPHVGDARRRLATFAAAEAPPPSYTPIVYDVPPPPPPEVIYVDRPVLVFSDPVFALPPPPPPVIFVAPPPVFLPPPPPVELFVLPVPAFVPVPVYVTPPVYVAPPPNNVIFTNIHNTTVINNVHETTVINTPAHPGGAGVGAGVAAGVAAGAAAGAAAARVALPPSIARRFPARGQNMPQGQPGQPQPVPGQANGPPGAVPAARLPAGHELPGVTGQPSAGKPPAGAADQPGNTVPSAAVPPGQEGLGAKGKPGRGENRKPGAAANEPGAAAPQPNAVPPLGQGQPGSGKGKPPAGTVSSPDTAVPLGQEGLGAKGKPGRGGNRKPGAAAPQPNAVPPPGQVQPGSGKGKPPAGTVSSPDTAVPPGQEGLGAKGKPGRGGNRKPGAAAPQPNVVPPGQGQPEPAGKPGPADGTRRGHKAPSATSPLAEPPPGKQPRSQFRPNERFAPAPAAKREATVPGPGTMPAPQQVTPKVPKAQQWYQPQPGFQPQHMPQQFQPPQGQRQPASQGWRQPQQAVQQPRQQQPVQQPRQPPAQKFSCGLPGQPPCH